MGNELAKQRNGLLEMIQKNSEAITSSLPQHLTPERMLRVARTAIQTTPGLWDCDPQTIISSLVEASTLGLEPNGTLGEAALVPFRNKRTKRKECQLMVMYRGYIELADRTGKVEYVDAEVVYADDVFEFEQGSEPKLRHIKKLGGDHSPGNVLGVYALVRFLTGVTKFVVLDVQEIEKIRSSSKAKDGDAWRLWWSEMAKKTALRRLFKYTRLSPQLARATFLDDSTDGGVRPGENANPNEFDAPDAQTDNLKERLRKAQEEEGDDDTIDTTAEEVDEDDQPIGIDAQKVTPSPNNSAGEPSKFAAALFDIRQIYLENIGGEDEWNALVAAEMETLGLDEIDAASQSQKKKIVAALAVLVKG